MFWDPEPSNDVNSDEPVWCLGRSYKLDPSKQHSSGTIQTATKPAGHDTETGASPPNQSPLPPSKPSTNANAPETPPASTSSSLSSAAAAGEELPLGNGWPPGFTEDMAAKFWMTYRSGFEPIPKSADPRATSALSFSVRIKSTLTDPTGFSSDSGWGCMIRSGQSLLATTIATLQLGRDWRRGQNQQEERKIISMFADDPRAPFSIHNFVRHGATACGKFPGEWFGPSATAQCIQALTSSSGLPLQVYSPNDGQDVYEDSFMKVAKPDDQDFRPTLILIRTRLGIDKITPIYWEPLIAALQMPQSVGIAGGRPSSSHYFVGSQGSYLFYLDPHHTRKAIPYHEDVANYTDEDIDSCHTSRLRRLHVKEMDPSMLIGFLIRSESDWADWRQRVESGQGKAIIHVADREHTLYSGEGRDGAVDEVEVLSDDDDVDDMATT
ncbi:protease required for autophagy [Trichoderma citrinoviride]|uniref:Cysteine protease n=1 Tax=Trichoderma citrinoviride TaxID=58853 RepID=A0A2T4BA39_9HYPO|nr:protease required for autophagy [Trichoderma citrinoviride]PTB66079.1 protease required for autophagy [Trichoderma citrinoviride]